MGQLPGLPPEILHSIFRLLDPEDLGVLPCICRDLRDHVDGNWRLFKDVYLQKFDRPQRNDVNWIKELRDLVKLRLICERETVAEKENELEFVHGVVDRFLKNASSSGQTTFNSNMHCVSRNTDYLKKLFYERSTREAFLEKSFLFDRVRKLEQMQFPDTVQEKHQQSAKLHCLFGKPILNIGRLRSTRTYPFACSKVYDLREYSEASKWGPFMADGSGRVDWEKLEAIILTLGYNIHSKRYVTKLFSDVWDTPFSGSYPKSCLPPPKVDPMSLEARDPYGVTGTWYRIVCFLDFNDFLSFNFPMGPVLPADTPRQPIGVGEATRLIVLQIHVTKIEPPGPDDSQDLPVVHFMGLSRTVDQSNDENGNTGVLGFTTKGQVRLTKEGEVRWTTVSVFHGHERWRSEGIQIGGIQSGRGVVGTWFDNDHDAHGPAGPTAYWKASNSEQVSSRLQDMLPNGFLAYTALIEMDPDPEGEMDYTTDDNAEEEEEDAIEFEVIQEELPALLQDAELELPPPLPETEDTMGETDDTAAED